MCQLATIIISFLYNIIECETVFDEHYVQCDVQSDILH